MLSQVSDVFSERVVKATYLDILLIILIILLILLILSIIYLSLMIIIIYCNDIFR